MTSPTDSGLVSVSPQVINVDTMTGPEFEGLVAQLFEKMGFQVEMTKASHDGGIDLIAHCHVPLLQGRYVIQCKRYDGAVGEPFLRDLFGVVTAEHANKGILVTNSTFTSSAQAFALGKPLELIDGIKLHDLLVRNQILTVAQITNSFENDCEVARLRQLIHTLPDELRWRIKLAQYLLRIIESPRGITSRETLMPYVEEAELQLSAVFENSQRKKGKVFAFLEHSSTVWLGWLQLLQLKADEAVRWMAALRTGIYMEDGPIEAPAGPGILDRFYMANAVNLANIAASCGKPSIRQQLFQRHEQRIRNLAEYWKSRFVRALKSDESDPGTVEYALKGIKRMDLIHEDIDMLFRPMAILRDFNVLESTPDAIPYSEIDALFSGIGSISQIIVSPHGFTLGPDGISMNAQGDAVERVLLPYLEAAEESEDGGWQVVTKLRKGDRIKIKSGSFRHFHGIVEVVFLDKGTARVLLPGYGAVASQVVDVEFLELELVGAN